MTLSRKYSLGTCLEQIKICFPFAKQMEHLMLVAKFRLWANRQLAIQTSLWVLGNALQEALPWWRRCWGFDGEAHDHPLVCPWTVRWMPKSWTLLRGGVTSVRITCFHSMTQMRDLTVTSLSSYYPQLTALVLFDLWHIVSEQWRLAPWGVFDP